MTNPSTSSEDPTRSSARILIELHAVDDEGVGHDLTLNVVEARKIAEEIGGCLGFVLDDYDER